MTDNKLKLKIAYFKLNLLVPRKGISIMNKKKCFASILLLFSVLHTYAQTGGPMPPPPPPTGPPIPPGLPIDNHIIFLIVAALVLGIVTALKIIKSPNSLSHKDV